VKKDKKIKDGIIASPNDNPNPGGITISIPDVNPKVKKDKKAKENPPANSTTGKSQDAGASQKANGNALITGNSNGRGDGLNPGPGFGGFAANSPANGFPGTSSPAANSPTGGFPGASDPNKGDGEPDPGSIDPGSPDARSPRENQLAGASITVDNITVDIEGVPDEVKDVIGGIGDIIGGVIGATERLHNLNEKIEKTILGPLDALKKKLLAVNEFLKNVKKAFQKPPPPPPPPKPTPPTQKPPPPPPPPKPTPPTQKPPPPPPPPKPTPPNPAAGAEPNLDDIFGEGFVEPTDAEITAGANPGGGSDGGGGNNPGPGTGGPAADSPAGGSQAASGNAPGTGVGDNGGDGGNGGDTGGGSSGADSQGGGMGCFTGDTPILMADGSSKPIAEVQIGDMVMAFEGLGKLSPQRVINVLNHYNSKIVNLNGVRVTPEHRFLTAEGDYKRVDKFVKGDILVADDSSLISDWTIKAIDGEYTVHNLTIENLHTFVAGGFRVHNIK